MPFVVQLTDLSTNPKSFDQISSVYYQCKHVVNDEISIDLGRVGWIDGHLSAAILCVIRKIQARGNRVAFINSVPRITNILQRNGLFQSGIKSETGTVIPLTAFKLDQGVDYSNFIRRHLNRMKFPKMTESLRGKIYEGLDEVFMNASIHSISSTDIFACGQFFPKYERIDFSITDGGIGISGAYKQTFLREISACDAIEWAMTEGSTTRVGDIPGGLGLKILRHFIRLNSGRFIVVSRDGYWTEQNGIAEKKQLTFEFPGTVVTIEVNTADGKAYDLANVPSPQELW